MAVFGVKKTAKLTFLHINKRKKGCRVLAIEIIRKLAAYMIFKNKK
jgi:hypothetical protein